MMTAVIAIYSNKGGVGKTATAVNLAYVASQAGYKTLICDLDPQSSTTFYFRVKPKLKKSARGFMKAGKPIDNSIKGTDFPNLDLLPADFNHRNLDVSFIEHKKSSHRLERILNPLREEYELIFLDCPPTINILAENIFNASDKVLVPLIPTTLSVRTYAQLLSFYKQTDQDVGGIYSFFSMVDKRKKMHREMATAVYKKYDNILETPIPYLSIVEQMGVQRQPVPAFVPRSAASKAYQALWNEFEATALG